MRKPVFTFRYKIRNWPEYNRALFRRGQLTLWFDVRAVGAWRDTARSSGPGRPKVYADAAIECALVLKSVFHLSLRATQGFLGSVVTRCCQSNANLSPVHDSVAGQGRDLRGGTLIQTTPVST
jgi:hypothetical protein